jgi:heme/copper-type cytochrome/quinol oxidase subunit 3
VCSSDLLTIVLGVTFTTLQAYEYFHAHFTFAGATPKDYRIA